MGISDEIRRCQNFKKGLDNLVDNFVDNLIKNGELRETAFFVDATFPDYPENDESKVFLVIDNSGIAVSMFVPLYAISGEEGFNKYLKELIENRNKTKDIQKKKNEDYMKKKALEELNNILEKYPEFRDIIKE